MSPRAAAQRPIVFPRFSFLLSIAASLSAALFQALRAYLIKAMPPSNEKATKVTEEALARLSAELEVGKSETLKTYLAAMGRFRHYSWNNVFLIAAQRPNATQVAGFHAWHDLGRSVKKGEKGIMIFAPMMVKREDSPAQPKETQRNDPFRLAGFRTAYVFDISQTEGKPLPEFAKTTGDPKDYTDKLRAMAAGRGIAVEYDPSITPAMGISSGGHIRLKPDLSRAEEFAVLVHELAHEMLHHGKDIERLPKVVRETQAEAVAFVVCQGIGLETNNAAADYIALYNGDKKTLTESLSVIQETSATILDELLPEEGRTPSAEHSEQAKQAAPEPPAPTPQEPISWDR